MKKYVFLAAALILSLAMTGCTGSKKADNAADATPKVTAASDTNTAGTENNTDSAEEPAPTSKYDEYFTDADKDVDMEAIDGDKAKVAEDSNAKGDVNGSEVKIGDAKIVEVDGEKVIVVSFDFKNNTAEDVTFNGLLRVDANQEDAYLNTSLTLDAEGYVPETLVQIVGSGDKITVQRAFTLYDDTTPVTITVENAVNPYGDTRLTKTFNIK